MRIINILSSLLLATILFSCLQKSNTNLAEKKRSGETDGAERALWQEYRMTRDPQLGIIPNDRLAAAKQYMDMLEAANGTARIQALSWEERGPNNVGGRTRSILIDKRDATGNTVLATSVSGGIFRSTNFTSPTPSWTVINDFLPNLAISVIIQDPSHPDTLFAGTGEGWGNIDAGLGKGIYKSTNGGLNWSLLASTSGFEYVQDLAIDNNGNLYAALRNLTTTNRGVMRSTDRGNSWTQVLGLPLANFLTGRAADLEVAPNGDVYATLGVFSRTAVWKSSFAANGANTGALGTWTDITPVNPTVTQRAELVVAPSDATRVYLILQDSATSQVLNMYRSNNSGANWIPINVPSALNNGSNSQCWYNLIGAVDPNNADVIVVGGLNLAKSTDGGNNWTQITSSSTVHVDHHALAFDGSAKLVSGNDGGIYYTTNINTASPVFTSKNNGFNVTQLYGCDMHPSTTNYFLAGAQDNFTLKFTSAGMNAATIATGGDGGIPHIDQTDGNLQITSNTSNNYYRSINAGASFTSLGAVNNDRGQFINPTDLNDAQKALYCGDDPGKYYVVSGLTGTPAGLQVTVAAMGNREVTAVKVDPFTANTIWLGCSYGTPTVKPVLLKLNNASTSTPTVVLNVPIDTTGASISSIDVDPANSNNILVTLSNYGTVNVYLSTNGGVSFTNIEGNLPDMPVRWGMFAPANAQLNGAGGGNGGILLATELGVWTTSTINGSSTVWIPNNTGLANVRTDMLRYRSADNLVAAATHGRGLYTTILPTVVTGINPPANTKDFIRYISSENRQLLIAVGNLATRKMTIQLFNMAGQEVYNNTRAYQNTIIGLSGLAKGVYTLRCTGDKGEIYLRKLVNN